MRPQYTVVLRRPGGLRIADSVPYAVVQVRADSSMSACIEAQVAQHRLDNAEPIYTHRAYEVVAVFFGFCDIALHSFQVPR